MAKKEEGVTIGASQEEVVAMSEEAAEIVAEKAAEQVIEAKSLESKGYTFFASTVIEISPYDILCAGENIRPVWDSAKERLIFAVPDGLADRFREHHHVKTGRLIEVGKKRPDVDHIEE